MSNYSRYKKFTENGTCKIVPFVTISNSTSDCYTYYEVGKSRLDLISYQYYNDPNYGWLILQANPTVGSLEFEIEDKTRLRIPYPLESAVQRYESAISMYEKLYGLNED